ncbi:MAG: DUF1778 domain-containing protein [Bifidobacteriaceae bacterium]|jgi:uncharacterized protein (DUF1778 family)|nr:DUF1778 domain-containing protein [Bifidobacteriaceae bacterium]
MLETESFEVRFTPHALERIHRAARISGEDISTFTQWAAQERAERVILSNEASAGFPLEFLDQLLALLEASTGLKEPVREAEPEVDPFLSRMEAARLMRDSVLRD